MKNLFAASIAAASLFLGSSGFAADEPQQCQSMMREHGKAMQDMMAQMQSGMPVEKMTPEQMRGWIQQHMKLMQQMMGQMGMQGMPGMERR